MVNESLNLKPCPFCGSSKKLSIWLSITRRGKPILGENGKQLESVMCSCLSFSIPIKTWQKRAK